MQDTLACQGCDLLVNVAGLSDGESARCPRCGHFLTRRQADATSRVLACAIAGLLFLAVANSFPFLGFSAKGLESVMTLPETALELYEYGMPMVALLVGAFIVVLPGLVLLLLLSLCLPLHLGRDAPWLVTAARWVFTLKNWVMVEVFIIGVIVSLVKLSSMARVTLGVSFWSYAAFSVCFTLALVSLDRYQCWRRIEQLGARE